MTGPIHSAPGTRHSALHVLGVRHHGPGSARLVLRALEQICPDAVLIEGPPDADEVLSLAGREEMQPPVALLVYEPDDPRESSYYPFATFSPEWQAMRWALLQGKAVRFIDLPHTHRGRRDKQTDEPESAQEGQAEPDSTALSRHQTQDPLESLARAAGYEDGEAWWGQLIEEHRGGDNPLALFEAIRDAMADLRAARDGDPSDPTPANSAPGTRHSALLEGAREAHMRRCVRAAMKEGLATIAVVCGAWHAPVLTAEALKQFPAKADDALVKDALGGQPKRKTAATWIPWTHDRLCAASGYGAGIASPGWYEHLWLHHHNLSERWLTRIARLMRDEDLDASPASVIESVRLADSLAALRGRSIAGLEELGEATLSILCHGNTLPLRVIEQKLIIGNRLGSVPDDVPAVPLQRDLAAQQKSLRLKVTADQLALDLDQRKENDLARSRLLHRLAILDIPWGTLEHDQQQRTSTFHEVWVLQWQPEFAVRVMEAARWGGTVEEAATACVVDRAGRAAALSELTGMLEHVLKADLPRAVESLIARIQNLSAVSTDFGSLMDALPPMARVLRYGNVRKTDAALVEPVVAGLAARVCAGLLPACGSLDDDAAGAMRSRIDRVHGSLSALERQDLLTDWHIALRRLADADIHDLVAGRALRLLLDGGSVPADQAGDRLSLALSRGNDPGRASAWLEGFLGGSGMILIHDERLLSIVDGWVCSLPRATFEQVCPIARRTFSTFEAPERRQIGERLRRSSGPSIGSAQTATPTDDYDAQRGRLVDPVLAMILGEPLP